MLTKNEIFEKVLTIIEQQLGVSSNKIELSSTIQNDLGADSLDSLELVTRIEELFNVDIPQHEVLQIETVGDIVNSLEGILKD